MSLYDDLGVPPDASADEIKAAGRAASKRYHPDRPGGDQEKFDAARKALTVLSDPARREWYDRTGEAKLGNDPEADELREAGQMLMNGMVAVISNPQTDPDACDVMAQLRAHLDREAGGLANAKREHAKGLERIGKFAKRLKVKEGSDDPVGQMLRAQQAAIQQGLATVERSTRVIAKAREILKAYSYTFERRDPAEAYREMNRMLGNSPFLNKVFDTF